MSWKKYPKKIFFIAIFFGCLIFVSHRGFKCFQKYLSEPEGIDINYHFSGKVAFPSFTFCHQMPKRILEECNLTSIEYDKKGIWIGNGSENCTDPKILKERVKGSFMDLEMLQGKILRENITLCTCLFVSLGLMISTFDNHFQSEPFFLDQLGNETLFEWTSLLISGYYSSCHTLSLKQGILKHGLKQVKLIYRAKH